MIKPRNNYKVLKLNLGEGSSKFVYGPDAETNNDRNTSGMREGGSSFSNNQKEISNAGWYIFRSKLLL